MASTAIGELIVKVSDAVRNTIYLTSKDWIESDKPNVRYIGVRALSELAKFSEFSLNKERVKFLLETIISRYLTHGEIMAIDQEVESEVEYAMKLFVELIRLHLDLAKNVLKANVKLQTTLMGEFFS